VKLSSPLPASPFSSKIFLRGDEAFPNYIQQNPPFLEQLLEPPRVISLTIPKAFFPSASAPLAVRWNKVSPPLFAPQNLLIPILATHPETSLQNLHVKGHPFFFHDFSPPPLLSNFSRLIGSGINWPFKQKG